MVLPLNKHGVFPCCSLKQGSGSLKRGEFEGLFPLLNPSVHGRSSAAFLQEIKDRRDSSWRDDGLERGSQRQGVAETRSRNGETQAVDRAGQGEAGVPHRGGEPGRASGVPLWPVCFGSVLPLSGFAHSCRHFPPGNPLPLANWDDWRLIPPPTKKALTEQDPLFRVSSEFTHACSSNLQTMCTSLCWGERHPPKLTSSWNLRMRPYVEIESLLM